jgi:hypothetical protein
MKQALTEGRSETMSVLGSTVDITLPGATGAKRAATPNRSTWVKPYDYVLVGSIAWALLLWAVTGIPLTPIRPWMLPKCLLTGWFLGAAIILIAVTRFGLQVARTKRLHKRRLRAWWARHFGARSIVAGVRYVITLTIVMTVYSSVKQAIPFINPTLTDQTLIAIERAVHLGWNPAWALQEVQWPTWWLLFLDNAYYAWFTVMPLVGGYFLVHRNRRKKYHFLSAFMAIWLVGVAWGLLFPSHGPCYVDSGNFPPAGMIMSRGTQVWLWDNYTALSEITMYGLGNLVYGCGLMALPSLHVTVVCLFAVFLWNEGPWLRWGSIAFALVIFIGSVQSGWHYAIDGYLGLLIAWLVTWGTSRLPGIARVPRQGAKQQTIPSK